MPNHQLAEWIVQQTSDALIYADRQGNIQSWNAAASGVNVPGPLTGFV